MIWWQNTVIMHLSCKWAWWTFFGTYSTYILLQADSACKNVHELAHDVVPQKDMFCKEHIHFGWCIIFKMVCPSSIFWSVWLSSIIQWTRSTWNSFVHLHVFCMHVNFYDHVCNHIMDPVHDRINDLFNRSRVQTPGLAHDLICGSRVWFPNLAAWSFCGSRVWFPDPITCFRP